MRVAAVDIGTNSTRLLIVEHSGDGSRELDRRTTVTGLGRGVDRSGQLADDAMTRTVETLNHYARRAGELRAERVVAVATSATRDASNREEFLRAAETALGVWPKVISGEEEARLAFAGAAAGFGTVSLLVVDIGGGSTEFVTADAAHSADVGSVRLTERTLPDRPASFEQLQRAARHAADLLAQLPAPPAVSEVIGVAGTWTSLSAIAQELPGYDRAAVHHSRLSRLDVDRLVVSLAARTLDETAAIPSLDPARAPVILGGAIVARECMRRIGIDQVLISEHDLLDGLAGQGGD